ncbi:MAG TPA: asparagine synthase (glutamine-hydrolyzing) [Acidiphilium sp.]|nr:MAG: asparagine synthase (glutamine-hydrolyzing) [Acidiphilium sp. 21-60-14]OYV89478.1 MAG: asparagine synthase (glutamine-hydrolyzing) [Acidiphilium sp. 37-60-79]HQT87516.1 asparagine synthase (glutamine-hydrolyzing) [Acidiphilium sp.]HQU23486.1 asparagine synthase (glutamine-hydrolyzing) [Acidiphilium sp.]
MCGIAGIAFKPGAQITPEVVSALARGLAHRGPDGMGSHVSAHAALVQTRLAIIDLATGDQPLFGAGSVLIGNGEIYNNRELRATMPNVAWTSGSDCEPPLYLARDQPDMMVPLRGMYALAIDRSMPGDVLLARDPFGIKPLYTAMTDRGLAFASEPQALIGAGLVQTAIRPEKLVELLQLQFTTGTQTVFAGIDRMTPGDLLTLRDGHIVARTSHPAIAAGDAPSGEDAAVAMLDRVLQNSVEMHQRSDVPYGMFLSGGIDSAAILAVMARLNTAKVQAFTAGFDTGSVADERDAAAATAHAVGARHERIDITATMMWRHLPQIVAAMDDPVADYAIIPTWFLARHAAGSVKVVLSGEGGDEMFAGYGRYRAAMRPWPFGRPMRSKGGFERLGVLRGEGRDWRAGLAASNDGLSGSRLVRAQRADIAEWLPNDLLLKLDRCLMAHGVEGRTPFVDQEVARFALALPDRLRVQQGFGKYLLRRWLAQNLPAARPFARKQGFDVPVAAWIAAQGERLGELVARAPMIAELAEPGAVRLLFAQADQRRAGMACWRLLFLALWHHRHGLGGAVDGDVFEVLAG